MHRWAGVAIALVVAMHASTPALARAARSTIRVPPDSSVAARFAGCYRLTWSRHGSNELRLTLHRVGARFDARAYGPGASNGAGNAWSWIPVDDSTFRISWGGIDGAMEFRIVQRGVALVAHGTEYWGDPVRETRLDPRIRRVACPLAAGS